MNVRTLVKRCLPSPALTALQRVKHFLEFGVSDHRIIFGKIYRTNHWGSKESRSGPGSEMSKTSVIRNELSAWLEKRQIMTFIDLPCGDFNWMEHIKFPDNMTYIGIDIVEELIAENSHAFSCDKRQFLHRDIINDALPDSDALFVKDLFIHFPNASILHCLNRIRRKEIKTTFLMTSHFPNTQENLDIKFGMDRRVNLSIAPFNLGQPLEMLKDFDDMVRDRYIGVWKID